MAKNNGGEFEDIQVNPLTGDDIVGTHQVDDVVRWASRLLDVQDPRAMRVIERLQAKRHGRLIVMRHPEQGEWGPIGFVLPVNREVDTALIAFVTGNMYVVEPMADDENGYISTHFAQTYYPNEEPLVEWAHDVRAAERRLMQYRLPFDRTTMLTNRDPMQQEEVDDAVMQALSTAEHVQFDLIQRESINRTTNRLFDGLGRILGLDDEQ